MSDNQSEYTSLSVLIPVFNRDVSVLVRGLCRQAERLHLEYEVILLDDASDERFVPGYEELVQAGRVRYFRNHVNQRRAAARNRLADMADFQALLFMDCDAALVSENYLKNYLDAWDGISIIAGGTIYDKYPPHDHILYLRWKYGKKREAIPTARREKDPWKSFSTFHFLAPKNLFSRIRFDENLYTYGHEDTLFGYMLEKNEITVKHIDNPLRHNGLEPAAVFLEKTREAACNLAIIRYRREGKEMLIRRIRLLNFYYRYKIIFSSSAFLKMAEKWESALYTRLQNNPSLFFFDMFKLCAFVRCLKKKEDTGLKSGL